MHDVTEMNSEGGIKGSFDLSDSRIHLSHGRRLKRREKDHDEEKKSGKPRKKLIFHLFQILKSLGIVTQKPASGIPPHFLLTLDSFLLK
jgi:hypothetical protein